MAKSYPEYQYDLADGVIGGLEQYRADRIVDCLKEKSGAEPGREDFREAGQRAASTAVELGKKYLDRTGEMIEEVAAKTGVVFPPVMQRYLEIWLLGTGLAEKWLLKQSTIKGMVYEVNQCALGERAGREWPGVKTAACAGYCAGALETLSGKLGMALEIKREDLGAGHGPCVFTIIPKQQ
ncbi:MAG: hypothetical protein ACOY40_06570 [Bacillota bacterium]